MLQLLLFLISVDITLSWPDWKGDNVKWAEHCDFSENNLYNKPSTGEQCGGICESEPRCTNFVWTDYNAGTCWLKSGSNLPAIGYSAGYSVCGYIQGKSSGGGGGGGGSGGQVPYGQLSVNGRHIVGSNGQPVQLHGMSLFWSQWMAQFYVADTIRALKCSWNSNVVRAAMGVEMGGYLDNPNVEMNKVYAVVDAAIANGIYVIVDWHDHNAQNHRDQAVNFFSQISKKYGSHPNIIYEIFNEPLQVSWSGTLKPYHEAVIQAIRANDPNNIIVVGTPNWSQFVDEAANDPINNYKNIAYILHYYAGTHKQDLRDRATTAMNKGLALFVTEYGTVNADGNGGVDTNESNLWWEFCDRNQISYVNWAIDDKNEGSAALQPGTSAQQVGDDGRLTESGRLVKNKYRSQNNGVSC